MGHGKPANGFVPRELGQKRRNFARPVSPAVVDPQQPVFETAKIYGAVSCQGKMRIQYYSVCPAGKFVDGGPVGKARCISMAY